MCYTPVNHSHGHLHCTLEEDKEFCTPKLEQGYTNLTEA